jgi:FkbM family methyltransferase
VNRAEKLIRILAAPSGRRTFLQHGVAAGIEHEAVLRSVSFRTVVDIGANRGQFALVARHCNPEAAIVSFEPLPIPARRYRAIFADDARVTFHEAAIGPRKAKATIHISRCDDSSSLLSITARQEELFPGTREDGVGTVSVAPLEEFMSKESIEEPALLKLDVQGYELEALKGCETLLDRFSYVYVECSFVELYAGQALADEVIGWLRDRKFQLRGVYNMSYDGVGRAIQGDFLFTRTLRTH